MITGTALVLLSWALLIGLLLCLGGAAALLAGRGANADPRASRITGALVRGAMWWGLGVATVVVLIIGLWQPLTSGATAVIIMVTGGIMAALAVVVARHQDRRIIRPSLWHLSRWQWALIGALALGVVYLAVAALGPVTNYDTGLYHLGVIKYDGQYSTIPGLANLYFPFGYNTSQFPLAAVLGNGPWDGVGYRLLNGLMVTLMAVDLAIRVLGRRFTVGTYVLVVGALAAWVPMIALSDYWVTSPSSDSAVFVLTVVGSAYLTDALWSSRRWQSDAAVALVLAVLTFALRPLMIFYLAGVVCALAIHLVQQVRNARKSNSDGAKGRQPRLVWALVASLAGAVLLAQTARDYLLSGWFQYPLSLFAFDVPWRADDPTSVRTATLGAARDPSRMWEAAAGWDWIPGWVERLPRQWETYEFFGLALVAVGCALVASRVRAPLRPRVLALAIMPSALTALAWFAAGPPTFRFVWGPALTLVTLPVGWILFHLSRVRKTSQTANTRPMQAAIGVFVVASVVVVGYSLGVRIDTSTMTEDRQWRVGPLAVGYRVTPIIQSPVSEGQTVSGLKVLMPRETDQCWDEFPMCSPQVAGSLTGRSQNLQDGLLIRPVAPPA